MAGKYPVYMQVYHCCGYEAQGQNDIIYINKMKGGIAGWWNQQWAVFPYLTMGTNIPDDWRNAARTAGVPIYNYVVGGDQSFFSNPSTWTNIITTLVNGVETYGYDGIDIDCEGDFTREGANQFYKQLADALHAKNKKLIIAVGYKTADYGGDLVGGWSDKWDVAYLGQVADYLNIMMYNNDLLLSGYNNDYYLRKCLDYYLYGAKVPKEKVVVGFWFPDYSASGYTVSALDRQMGVVYNDYGINRMFVAPLGAEYDQTFFWDLIGTPEPDLGVCIKITTKAAPTPISPILAAALIGAGGLVIMNKGGR